MKNNISVMFVAMAMLALPYGIVKSKAEAGQGAASNMTQPYNLDNKKRQMDPMVRLELMSRGLALTDEQKAQIKKILEYEAQYKKSVQDDGSLSPDKQHDKMLAIARETYIKIKINLTTEQQKKFEAKHEQMQERRKGQLSKP